MEFKNFIAYLNSYTNIGCINSYANVACINSYTKVFEKPRTAIALWIFQPWSVV